MRPLKELCLVGCKKELLMAKQNPFVTVEQWIRLEPWRPKPKPSAKGGRKPRGNRAVFDRIIWLLRSGASWNDLADRYP